MSAQTIPGKMSAWQCPHCSAQNTTRHDPDFRHMLVTCDIDAGGCGRTVIVDAQSATAYRAIKSFDPVCAPLVDVDREYVYPPKAEGICAADARHDDHERRLVDVETSVNYLMRRFKVTNWESEGR